MTIDHRASLRDRLTYSGRSAEDRAFLVFQTCTVQETQKAPNPVSRREMRNTVSFQVSSLSLPIVSLALRPLIEDIDRSAVSRRGVSGRSTHPSL